MELKITEFKFGERPDPELPDNAMLDIMGEEGVRNMVSDHYDLLVQSEIKDMFPPSGLELDFAKEKSADFFVQRLGGPAYFNEKHGNPMLSRRHQPFDITLTGRKVWLGCYREVLLKLDIPQNLIVSYWNFLDYFSMWMVNTQESVLFKK